MRNVRSQYCAIFDLDGTLVDSETLNNQAFADLLPDLNESVASLVVKYRGRNMPMYFLDFRRYL